VPQPLTLEWFGCTTFRVRVAGLTLFFDTYLDRPASIPDVGLTSSQVGEADFAFVSHAHYDHMLGSDTIAANAGATIVGSYETTRVLRENRVPASQLLPVSGGETIDCGHDVRVRVFPSLHSCLFARSNPDSAATCIGDLGISHQERAARVAAIFESMPSIAPDLATYLLSTDGHSSRSDGGQLNYLLETPEGSILVNASSGYWTGILRDLRPDVAVIALAGRPNVDGEPHQGSLAQFLVDQVELLKPQKVLFCHHDVLLPPLIPGIDPGEAIASLARETSYARYVEVPYSEAVPILG
jgi:L-ascorbate metabolism protein UlaG (beta-lactamase superfamily)